MRQPAKSIQELKFTNDFCCIPLDFGIFQSFEEALSNFKKLFSNLKNSLEPFSVLYAFKLTINLPYIMP